MDINHEGSRNDVGKTMNEQHTDPVSIILSKEESSQSILSSHQSPTGKREISK